jgi:hypothetical protein
MPRRRGAAAPNACFTPVEVSAIRTRHAAGEKPAALAREHGCSYWTLWRLVNRVTYREEELTDACTTAP